MNAINKLPLDPKALAHGFDLLDRTVWIVTAQAGNRRGGLVATWVSQASLDPERPTLLAGLAPNHFTCELIEAAGVFGLHLLRGDQASTALPFCLASGSNLDKLAQVPYELSPGGVPWLTDCLVRMECHVFARLASGDRTYFWAEVRESEAFGTETPLSEKQLIAAATPAEKATLAADRQADLERHRPWAEAWRAELPPLLQPPPAEGIGQ